MAMNIGKKKKGEAVIPSKKTMNFVHHTSGFNPWKVIPIALVLVIASGVFVKFGILDYIDKKTEARNALASKQEQLAQLKISLQDYDEVLSKFGRYSYGWMDTDEVTLVNRMEVFKLLESKISPKATIENFAVNNNALTMNIKGLTLEAASAVVKDLESSDLVESAIVYDAVAKDGEEAAVFLSIILTNVKEAQ